MKKPIGELNGWWAFLLKATLTTFVPLILLSQIWMANRIWVLDTSVTDMMKHLDSTQRRLESTDNDVRDLLVRVYHLERNRP